MTLGLPDNDDERHAAVEEKLTEMIIASLKYTFSHKLEIPGQDLVHAEIAQQKLAKDLTAATIDACISMDNPDFLFKEVYEVFDEYSQADVFLEVLEPYILNSRVTDVPPTVMKDVTTFFVGRGDHVRLEQVICHINPASLDIDQISGICLQHHLYDALSYVYSNGLKDCITPMVEFIKLVRDFFANHHQASTPIKVIDIDNDQHASVAFDAFKVFPYLSYILTGRVYPTGRDMLESDAYDAKQSLYFFLFSGRTLSWPREGGTLVRTTDGDEPTFPYLRLLLQFDAAILFQAMDEAFEDRFLNGSNDSSLPSSNATNGLQSFGRAINRQFIVNIFLEVMSPTDNADIIYLYMFIARNLPKYPQFILLSGTTIEGILLRLCTYGSTEMAEEAQLAAEYLLSVFKPTDSEKMIAAYQEAKFYRILKSTLRAEGRFTELLDVFLKDEDKLEVFDCVDGLLRGGSKLSAKQRDAVKTFLLGRLEELVEIDVSRTATMFEHYMPERQKDIVQRLSGNRSTLFVHLDTIISQVHDTSEDWGTWLDMDLRELYVSLMCEFQPTELTTYLENIGADQIRIEKILPVLEKFEVIDAIVLVLRRAGLTKEAMHKVVIHITSLQRAIPQTLRRGIGDAENLVGEVGRYAFVGADLCETFSRETVSKSTVNNKGGKGPPSALNDAEQMWLTLLETVVNASREITITFTTADATNRELSDQTHILDSLRVVVQDIFTRLLTLTSSTATSRIRRTPTIQVSFLAILRKFLQNLGSSPLTDLRPVLSSIFDAYRYERQLIQVTSKLVETDLFEDFLKAKQEREKGWRPASANCMACGRILFGPGAKGSIFAKWEQRRLEAAEKKLAADETRRRERQGFSVPGTPDGKGKGKGVDPLPSPVFGMEELPVEDIEGDIVVFGCGHTYHRGCLSELGGTLEDETEYETAGGTFHCINCDAR